MGPRLRDLLILGTTVVFSSGVVWLAAGMRTVYENFDGPYHAVVARCGYDKQCIGSNFEFPLPLEYYPAHFPLYPWLVRLAGNIGNIGLLPAGVGVNVLGAVAGAAAIYFIWEKMKWGNPILPALVWLFAWPRMWAVRSVAGPETLFILGIVLSLYFFQVKKYWLAGLAGALATLTKSPGILLFATYSMLWLRRPDIKMWPVLVIPAALAGLFGYYGLVTGDFWAYFNSGDNIHLQILPFRVFDSSQPWVGNFWLEDVLWIYLAGVAGVVRAFKKSQVWGMFGAVFLTSILFVSHRDISRYSLPLVPVVLLGMSDLLERKEIRWILAVMLVPTFFYTVNFLTHNTVAISNWTPFL